jgi:hypothetical protein
VLIHPERGAMRRSGMFPQPAASHGIALRSGLAAPCDAGTVTGMHAAPSQPPHMPGTIAVVGASPDPERTSYQAVGDLAAAGWTVWPIHPRAAAVRGVPCRASLDDLPGRPEVVTLYVNPTVALGLLDRLAALAPRALWLNPGADAPELVAAARARGLPVVVGCTLVALRTGRLRPG